MPSGMIRLAVLILAVLAASVACDTLGTPPAAPDGEPAPDVEATVRAVISNVQGTPQPTLQSGEVVDVQATITASVQATVEALRAATPIPSPTPTGAPAAILAPTPVTANNQLPTTTTAPPDTPPPQPTATLVPTATAEATPSPTPSPTPLPEPTPVSCGIVANGTQVTAWIDGQSVASAAVEGGSYTIFVDQGDGDQFSGKTVTFKIGSRDANESAVWVQGGASELDLTAPWTGAAFKLIEPNATVTAAAIGRHNQGGPLAQRVPPHVFVGTATVVC